MRIFPDRHPKQDQEQGITSWEMATLETYKTGGWYETQKHADTEKS